MSRLTQAFYVTVAALVVLGGVAAADYTRSLGTVEDAGLIQSQVDTEVLGGEVADGQFVLTVRIDNPTRFSLELNGAYVVVTDGEDQLTYGTNVNAGQFPQTVPAQGSLTVTYRFALSDSQAEQLRQALEEGSVTVTGDQSVTLRETDFSLEFSGEVTGR